MLVAIVVAGDDLVAEDPVEIEGETISPALVRVVRRCLEKRPDERFQSARDLAFAIENSSETSAVQIQDVDTVSAPPAKRGIAAWVVAKSRASIS